MLYFILPITLFGIAAYFYGPMYSILPIYESPQCWCKFGWIPSPPNDAENVSEHPTECTQQDKTYLYINQYSFITINWAELMILVVMIFIIRNIRDELNIKYEILIITLCWILFSCIYFVLQSSSITTSENETSQRSAKISIYTLIMMRNLSSLLTSAVFIWKTLRSNQEYKKDIDYPTIVNDFGVAISSVVASQKFEAFIIQQAPDFLAFWKMLQMLKILSGFQDEDNEEK